MGEVVGFGKHEPPHPPDQIILRCPCGCLSFYMRADGELECVRCHETITHDIGEWRDHTPPVPVNPAPPPTTEPTDVVITQFNNSEAAKRRVLGAYPDTAKLIAVIDETGDHCVWHDGLVGREELDWLEARLREVHKAVVSQSDPNQKGRTSNSGGNNGD